MKGVAGVIDTEVDMGTMSATCTVDPAKFKSDEAVTALKAYYKDAALKTDG